MILQILNLILVSLKMRAKAVMFMSNGKGLHFAVIIIVILVGLVWIQAQILYANVGMINKYLIYTSEIRRLCLMKLPSEILHKI